MSTTPTGTTLPPLLPQQLIDVLPALRATGAKIMVHQGPVPRRSDWIILERDGLVATVEHRRVGSYFEVFFPIKPSREIGWSFLRVGDNPVPAEGEDSAALLVKRVKQALVPRLANFATSSKGLPNHGMDHFSWCANNLIDVTEPGSEVR